ncbi:alpha/beta fold hydrolase [Arthrobacter sp. ZGTC212]|uniref:alpha/beta fold hydrolase n=1 Tax=Arthrobacter sp. ZGTC212 TaxID=2058899 RepID=UPI0021573187|nr:alpha/beta fold hydrolase [Arthrobacter sp. ZGTC212]
MYRNLIPLLADRYHVVAPDHLGFGLSDAPSVDEFSYSFDAQRRPCGPRSRVRPSAGST